jgi:hypothetical protein
MADPRTHRFTNNATGRLAEDLTVGETSIQLASGDGALFPDLNPGQIFVITVQHLIEGTIEIMFCTARAGDVLTVERGQEGTDAVEWFQSNNVVVQHRVTADTLEYLAETASGGNDSVVIQLSCSDLTTNLATGTNKAYFRAPRAFTLTEIRASLLTASSGGNVAVDINKNGTTILYAPVIIDQGEKTSVTSSSTTIIEDDGIADDDEISIDIVNAGTGAKGLIVTLLGAP